METSSRDQSRTILSSTNLPGKGCSKPRRPNRVFYTLQLWNPTKRPNPRNRSAESILHDASHPRNPQRTTTKQHPSGNILHRRHIRMQPVVLPHHAQDSQRQVKHPCRVYSRPLPAIPSSTTPKDKKKHPKHELGHNNQSRRNSHQSNVEKNERVVEYMHGTSRVSILPSNLC